MKIFSDRMLHIKGSAQHSRCANLYSLEQFRTQGFQLKESAGVQRCAGKNIEFASGSRIVGENQGEMGNSSVTQDSTHRTFS